MLCWVLSEIKRQDYVAVGRFLGWQCSTQPNGLPLQNQMRFPYCPTSLTIGLTISGVSCIMKLEVKAISSMLQYSDTNRHVMEIYVINRILKAYA